MKYNNLLDKIYQKYKTCGEYQSDNDIKIFKESNTNIVHFEFNDPNLKKILGTIIEQNHLILIYFKFTKNSNNYIFFSKTHVILGNRAIIYNCILNNGNLEAEETIGRDFKNRQDIFKFNNHDIIIDENLFDDCFDEIITDIINSDTKKYIKKN